MFVFLLRQYMLTLPYELDEAACIDGCNTWQILYKILVPLCWPPLTIVVVFTLLITYYFAQRHLIGGIASFGLKG